jgi:hypothetical protein
MTWGEFVAAAKAAGVEDSDIVDMIDIPLPTALIRTTGDLELEFNRTLPRHDVTSEGERLDNLPTHLSIW